VITDRSDDAKKARAEAKLKIEDQCSRQAQQALRRRATWSALALAAISRSSSAISSYSRRSISTSRIRQERAASGMPEAGSST
jgi:hypothetical protein